MLTPALLGPDHDITASTCGEPALEDWLRTEGLAAQNKGTSRVFGLTEDTDASGQVIAYGKLAIHSSRRGGGLGGQVLAEAIARSGHLAEDLGFRSLVVDARRDGAAAFYEHYGFTRVPTADALRLVLRIKRDLLFP